MAGFEDGRVEPEALVGARRWTKQGRPRPRATEEDDSLVVPRFGFIEINFRRLTSSL